MYYLGNVTNQVAANQSDLNSALLTDLYLFVTDSSELTANKSLVVNITTDFQQVDGTDTSVLTQITYIYATSAAPVLIRFLIYGLWA